MPIVLSTTDNAFMNETFRVRQKGRRRNGVQSSHKSDHPQFGNIPVDTCEHPVEWKPPTRVEHIPSTIDRRFFLNPIVNQTHCHFIRMIHNKRYKHVFFKRRFSSRHSLRNWVDPLYFFFVNR